MLLGLREHPITMIHSSWLAQQRTESYLFLPPSSVARGSRTGLYESMSNPNYDAIPNSNKVKTDESMIVFTGRVLSVSNDRVRNNELLNQSLDYVIELEIISVSEKNKKVKTSFDITMGYMSKYWQQVFPELNITEPETFEFDPVGIQFSFQSYTHDKIAYGKVGTLQRHDMVEIQCKRGLRGKIIRFDDKLPTLQEFKKNLYPKKADNYIQKEIFIYKKRF